MYNLKCVQQSYMYNLKYVQQSYKYNVHCKICTTEKVHKRFACTTVQVLQNVAFGRMTQVACLPSNS